MTTFVHQITLCEIITQSALGLPIKCFTDGFTERQEIPLAILAGRMMLMRGPLVLLLARYPDPDWDDIEGIRQEILRIKSHYGEVRIPFWDQTCFMSEAWMARAQMRHLLNKEAI